MSSRCSRQLIFIINQKLSHINVANLAANCVTLNVHGFCITLSCFLVFMTALGNTLSCIAKLETKNGTYIYGQLMVFQIGKFLTILFDFMVSKNKS